VSIDTATIKRVARLARIAVSDAEAEALKAEVNTILGFVEQLNEVDVTGVAPMTSVTHMAIRMRDDVVTDGGDAERVLANAPAREGDFFVVPKVVE
jgi:aspartyl-tRNA(Asn)/glutamyl-tRNA(Gln) amidotransferase subunit C